MDSFYLWPTYSSSCQNIRKGERSSALTLILEVELAGHSVELHVESEGNKRIKHKKILRLFAFV